MSRRRYTEKERADCLAEFERSGSSAAAFCREKGLTYQTFLNWRRRGALSLAQEPRTRESEFVEVDLPAKASSPGRGSADPAVELILAGGSILRIYPTPPHRS